MHLPNQILQGQICPITAGVSLLGIAGVSYFAAKSGKKPTAGRFAAVAAFIFAAQMANFPIANGTSGHFLGGALAAAVLGTPFGILAISLVVAIQTIIFSDGGLTVLGANILNMGIVGAGLSGVIINSFSRKINSSFGKSALIACASWISVVATALVCSFEIGVSGAVNFGSVIGAMISVHSVIGIVEALITIAVLRILFTKKENIDGRWSIGIPLILSAITVLVIAPFASKYPDGLNKVAEQYNLLHSIAPTFVSPLAGYSVGFVRNETLSLMLAGTIGIGFTFITSYVVLQILNKINIQKI